MEYRGAIGEGLTGSRLPGDAIPSSPRLYIHVSVGQGIGYRGVLGHGVFTLSYLYLCAGLMAPIGSLVPMGLVYATRNRVCYPLGAIASITLGSVSVNPAAMDTMVIVE